MIKKYKVKNIYITKVFCDKCGEELIPTGMCFTTYPAQYPFKCKNPNCDGRTTLLEHELPGKLEYDLEEELDICTELLH